MARARALLVLFTAARTFSSRAAAASPSPALAPKAAFGSAAAFPSPFLASKAAIGSAAAAAAASHSPALASNAALGSAVAPVGVAGAGGRGRSPFRLLGYAALASFAGAGIIWACGHSIDDDVLEEGEDYDAIRRQLRKDLGIDYHHLNKSASASGARIRAMTKMLKLVDRRMKHFMKAQNDFMKAQNEKKDRGQLWEFIEDLIEKGNTIKSAYNLANDFRVMALSIVSGSIYLIEKYGDPVQYFVCPYSGYNEAVDIFLFTVTPTEKGSGGSGYTAVVIFSNHRMSIVCSFAGLGTIGGITFWQADMVPSQINCKHHSLTDIKIDIKRIPVMETLMKALEETAVKKWENSSCGRKLILQSRNSWGNDFGCQNEEGKSLSGKNM